MKRQIDSSLFERLLLSRSDANKEQVLALAEKGVDYTKPEDIIKDPYVFEFLGLPEEKPFLESDLEAALVRQIEDFLLELGRGFMFVGTQQRALWITPTIMWTWCSTTRFCTPMCWSSWKPPSSRPKLPGRSICIRDLEMTKKGCSPLQNMQRMRSRRSWSLWSRRL